MTTSGSTNFNQNRDQIIRAALRKIGAIAAGETPDNQTIQDASDQLNALVKYWMASGIHVWTETEATLIPQVSQSKYVLGAPTTDFAAQTEYTTTLVSDQSQSDTVVELTSGTGLANGMNIGITLTTGVVFWTTVQSFSGTEVTLASGLSGAATDGAYIYLLTSVIDRPLRVPRARRLDATSGIYVDLRPLSRMDYWAMPNKNTASGTITQFFYDPRGGATNQGWFYVWPVPNMVSSNLIEFTWYRPIQDFDTASDTPDLPQEWINALIWNLAAEMAPEYGLPMDQYQIVRQRAEQVLLETQGWDREEYSTYFGVDFTTTQYGR